MVTPDPSGPRRSNLYQSIGVTPMRWFTTLLLLVPFLLAADRPTSDADLRYWLENMVWHHDYISRILAPRTWLQLRLRPQ